jgi:hypothetical protein
MVIADYHKEFLSRLKRIVDNQGEFTIENVKDFGLQVINQMVSNEYQLVPMLNQLEKYP